ncbi:hypothetical protein, partial [Rhizobium sp. BK376]|uniref:hypothetical protein n=1 Tax=Rhizobium sp. BK376 TaxID=2512149 RepID=UPI001A9ED96E
SARCGTLTSPPTRRRKARQSAVSYTTPMDTIGKTKRNQTIPSYAKGLKPVSKQRTSRIETRIDHCRLEQAASETVEPVSSILQDVLALSKLIPIRHVPSGN